MGIGTSVARMVRLTATVLTIVLAILTAGYSQTTSQCGSVEGFLQSLPGEWIGTVSQSTDGGACDIRYFHAVTKQLSPGTYESVFTYYRLDAKTGAPVQAGATSVATKIDTSGTATNTMTGKGDILVDAKTLKPEQHELTEVLSASPTGGLQGAGGGSISVTGMPLGSGKNGKVRSYSSTWSVSDDVLRISQRFKVEFRVLLFRKNYTITADYTANRGSDVLGLMKASKAELSDH